MTVDLDALFEPTAVSFGWVVQKLEQNSVEWRELSEKHLVDKIDYTTIGDAGFLSNVCKIVVRFKGTDRTVCAFLKSPTTEKFTLINNDATVAKFVDHMTQALFAYHNVEVNVYRHLATNCPGLRFPTMFGCEMAESGRGFGCLLLEDISSKGAMPDVIRGLRRAQIHNVVVGLARFHAFTLYSKTRPRILQLFDKTHRLQLRDDELALSRQLQATGRPYFKENKAAYDQLFEKHNTQLEKANEKFGIPPIFSHGDLWANNVFFYKDAVGNASDELMAFLDWQASYLSTGMNDLARFIFVSTPAEVITHELDGLLHLYYDAFVAELRANQCAIPYERHQLRPMFDHQARHEAIFATMMTITNYWKADASFREPLFQRLRAVMEVVKPIL